MKLLSLKVENFMPYKGKQEVEFPQDPVRNVMLIFGENMRGKTSFLNSIRWALYGKALGRHSREIPLNHVMNVEAVKEGDRIVEVTLTFEHEGSEYILRRTAELKDLVVSPNRPEDFTLSILLAKDQSPVLSDQIDRVISEIVPEQISRFFLFDGELLQEYETLLLDASSQGAQIKEAIEQVLGVPALSNAREHLQSLLRDARRLQQKDLDQTKGLEVMSQKHKDLSEKEELLDSELKSFREALEVTRQKLNDVTAEIEEHESIYAQSQQLEGVRTQRKILESSLETKEVERKDLLSGAWYDLLAVRSDVARSGLERERNSITSKFNKQARLESEIENLTTLLDKHVCPTCTQEISLESEKRFLDRITTLQRDLISERSLQNRLNEILTKISQIQTVRSNNTAGKLRKLKSETDETRISIVSHENRIVDLERELDDFKPERILRKKQDQANLIREETRLVDQIHDVEATLERTRTELTVLQHTYSGTNARSNDSTKRVEVLTALTAVFTNSISVLRDRLKLSVESKASEAFEHMTTQRAYKGLKINDNYGLQIIDRRDQEITVRSAGAEQIVALSLIDGLNRTGRGTGPVFMDTPFGRLDLGHRENVLRYLPTVTNQLVVLVHSGELRVKTDLAPIANRIGARYEIEEVNQTHSIIRRVNQ